MAYDHLEIEVRWQRYPTTPTAEQGYGLILSASVPRPHSGEARQP
jgi:hypothetical protein